VRFITEIESESNQPIRYTIEGDGRSTNGLEAFFGMVSAKDPPLRDLLLCRDL